MPSIGLGVIGAGYWGPKLVRTALASPQFQLRWLCDHHQDRARAILGEQAQVQITTRSDEVLADPGVAAVAIATPAGTHFELARAALQAGKHVLVEKPLTVTAAESEQLTWLASQSGLTLMCDHTFCYTPAAQRIREIIRSGEAGEIQFVDSVRVNLGLVQPDVDVLWDLAPHDLSILDFVLPAGTHPVAVAAQTADPVGTGRACLAHLSVWLSTGALVHVNVSWLSPTKIRTMTFGGTRRTIVWNDMDSRAPVTVYDRGVDRVPDCAQVAGQPGVTYRSGEVCVPDLPRHEALQSVMSEFAGAIVEHRAPLTDGSAGVRMLSVLEAASRSAAGGGIRVPIEIHADQADVACMVPLSARLGPAPRAAPAGGGGPAREGRRWLTAAIHRGRAG